MSEEFIDDCPYCEARDCPCEPLSKAISHDYQRVSCSSCGVQGPIGHDRNSAIGRWNAMPRVQPGHATRDVAESLLKMTECLIEDDLMFNIPHVGGRVLRARDIRQFVKEVTRKEVGR